MSGSGPTVYGLARKESQAKNIYNAVNGCCNGSERAQTIRIEGLKR